MLTEISIPLSVRVLRIIIVWRVVSDLELTLCKCLDFLHSQGLEVRNSDDVDVLALDKLKNLNAQCDKPFYLQLTQLVDKLVVAVGQRWEVNSRWRAQ